MTEQMLHDLHRVPLAEIRKPRDRNSRKLFLRLARRTFNRCIDGNCKYLRCEPTAVSNAVRTTYKYRDFAIQTFVSPDLSILIGAWQGETKHDKWQQRKQRGSAWQHRTNLDLVKNSVEHVETGRKKLTPCDEPWLFSAIPLTNATRPRRHTETTLLRSIFLSTDSRNCQPNAFTTDF